MTVVMAVWLLYIISHIFSFFWSLAYPNTLRLMFGLDSL